MLRCAELSLTDEALDQMTPGMIYDMLIERGNDQYEYPIMGTDADRRVMFGG